MPTRTVELQKEFPTTAKHAKLLPSTHGHMHTQAAWHGNENTVATGHVEVAHIHQGIVEWNIAIKRPNMYENDFKVGGGAVRVGRRKQNCIDIKCDNVCSRTRQGTPNRSQGLIQGLPGPQRPTPARRCKHLSLQCSKLLLSFYRYGFKTVASPPSCARTARAPRPVVFASWM